MGIFTYQSYEDGICRFALWMQWSDSTQQDLQVLMIVEMTTISRPLQRRGREVEGTALVLAGDQRMGML